MNLGALLTIGKFKVNLLEKIYGTSSEWENDDGDNPAGALEYYKTTISMTPITNLDLSYQVTSHLALSMGAINLLNRYPDHLNATLLSHYNNPAYGDSQGTIVYPTFSAVGFNGGFYFARGTFTF